MELEFPGFVLLLLVAFGLLAFGPAPQFGREHHHRVAAAADGGPCASAPSGHAWHIFGAPAPPATCTMY